MSNDIHYYIDLVERRIFELNMMIKEVKMGTRFDTNIKDLNKILIVNENMLSCLIAARDYGFSITLTKMQTEELPSKVLLRSVFPVGHPLHGQDDEYGEMASA
jgi:hypothetical protein